VAKELATIRLKHAELLERVNQVCDLPSLVWEPTLRARMIDADDEG
jgi:hypothetical protein